MRWRNTRAWSHIQKHAGLSFKSWRTTCISAAVGTLYILAQVDEPDWKDWCVAIGFGLSGLVQRDAKVSSQDEGVRE